VGIAVERIKGGFAAISSNTRTQSRRIHISLDGGITWKAIDEGLRPSLSISSIKQIDEYLLCGHPDGKFRSSDMGKTWRRVHSGVAEVKYGKTWNLAPSIDGGKVLKIYVSGHVLYAVARSAGC
jgi:photosystem II stability/assembly factor-like uncharacterized protein